MLIDHIVSAEKDSVQDRVRKHPRDHRAFHDSSLECDDIAKVGKLGTEFQLCWGPHA